MEQAKEDHPLSDVKEEEEGSADDGELGQSKQEKAMLTAVERELCAVGLTHLLVDLHGLGGRNTYIGNDEAVTTINNEEEEGGLASSTAGALSVHALVRGTKVLCQYHTAHCCGNVLQVDCRFLRFSTSATCAYMMSYLAR